jgi:hypothetical protein
MERRKNGEGWKGAPEEVEGACRVPILHSRVLRRVLQRRRALRMPRCCGGLLSLGMVVLSWCGSVGWLPWSSSSSTPMTTVQAWSCSSRQRMPPRPTTPPKRVWASGGAAPSTALFASLDKFDDLDEDEDDEDEDDDDEDDIPEDSLQDLAKVAEFRSRMANLLGEGESTELTVVVVPLRHPPPPPLQLRNRGPSSRPKSSPAVSWWPIPPRSCPSTAAAAMPRRIPFDRHY